ncbi:MAG TPA: apolipoprotein N-acyltransferase [Steroidobacteraceae bacterium]|nr:apolipoprotein N-acyltransferase [Steroidobacteraceae bacterium]
MFLRSSSLLRRVVALVTGALVSFSFAPLQWWPLAIVGPAVLMYLWEGARPREAAWLGFWFNFGTFVAGTYWLYTGLHVMGGAPAWIAFGLMLGLVSIMALYHAGLGYFVARWLPAGGPLRWMLAMPAAWVIVEWWRGWFLSGFAWLSLGYSQTDTWLAGFAPVVGVYGISAVLLVSAGALVALVRGTMRTRIVAVVVLIAPWCAGVALGSVEWTHASGKPVAVAIVQGAIPQNLKWLDSNHDATLKIYRQLADSALGTPLIVFPEASLPDLANELVDYLRALYRDASARGSAVVLGILRADEQGRYFNSVLALDEKVQWYDKDHLVPFAEFFPVPGFVRSWLRLMSLPYSDFTRGGADQPPLRAAGLKLATTICYEDGYGSAQLHVLKEADALVNVTNDAWFGHGSARHQHFQIARMRAIEAQRFMLRAANDGISGVIGPHGEVVARAPEFERFVLHSAVIPRTGLPPYARVGNWLILSLAAVALMVVMLQSRRRAGRAET